MLRPAKAIRARCLECAETQRQVRECESADCPLWLWRLGKNPAWGKKKPTGHHGVRKTVRLYCLWCCKQQARDARECPATDCSLWLYRLGKGVASKHSDRAPIGEQTPQGAVQARGNAGRCRNGIIGGVFGAQNGFCGGGLVWHSLACHVRRHGSPELRHFASDRVEPRCSAVWSPSSGRRPDR